MDTLTLSLEFSLNFPETPGLIVQFRDDVSHLVVRLELRSG